MAQKGELIMAYVKTNWKTGDVVTSSKLNNMETGIYDANEASASAFSPDIDNPQNGDVIKYDSTSEKWVNGAVSGASEDFVITCTVTSQDFSGTIDKTQAEINAAYLANKNFKLSVPAMNLVAIPTVFEISNPGTESLIVRAIGTFLYTDISGVYLVQIVTSDIQTYRANMYSISGSNT